MGKLGSHHLSQHRRPRHHVNILGAVVAKYAPHKENAIRLLEFLASDKGQELYADVNNEYPVKEGIPGSKLVSLGAISKRIQSRLTTSLRCARGQASSSTRLASTTGQAREGAK